jgi:tetratricopeptide (TPR) repeat protein
MYLVACLVLLLNNKQSGIPEGIPDYSWSVELLQKAIILDDTNAEAHGLLGFTFSMTRQHDKAVAEGEKAIPLNPNSADSHMLLGKILTFVGRYEESIAELQTAVGLNPILFADILPQ